VRVLVQDLLAFKPVLLYQGQYDAECGVASNDAWVSMMTW
jgi:vitellogenic carboxypeptidase-like protein